METGPAQKSLATLGLMALVILAPASVFAVTGDAPQTLILAAAGLALSAALRRPLERSTRSFVYTSLAALVLAVLSQQVFPVDDKRFFLVPAHVYCPPLIFLAVAITFLDHRDSNVSGVVGLAFLAMMMAGNCMDFQAAHRRLPIPLRWEVYLHPFYGAAVAVQLLACVPLMARAPFLRAGPAASRPRRRLRRLLVFGLLVLAAGGTLVLRRSAKHLEYFWQTGFTQLVQARLGRHRGVVFGHEVDLWRTVPHLTAADSAIVLRVLSREAPGYLRGRAYTEYRNGRWTAARTEQGLPAEQPGGRLTYSVFRRPVPPPATAPATVSRLDVYPANQFRSEVLLAPGNATAFELIADSLNDSADGELTPANWERQVGYSAVTTAYRDDAAYDGPPIAAATANAYLGLPDTLREPLGAVSSTVFASGPTDTGAALADLERFFRTHFRYELGSVPAADAGDPVVQFLTQRRSGHCELFATAAVLLLRSRGIPSRYVTGVVCAERAAPGRWTARLADLHAWAEAFDREQGRWLLVEVTPADGIPGGAERAGLLDRGLEQMAFSWQHVFALMKRGTMAEAIIAAVKGLGQSLAWLLLNPVGAPLALLLAVMLGRRWVHRARRALGEAELPAPRQRLRHAYLRALAALRRGAGALPDQPTPRTLARWVRGRCPGLPNPLLAEAFERYEVLRYGARFPQEEDIGVLEAQFAAGLREFRHVRLRAPQGNDADASIHGETDRK